MAFVASACGKNVPFIDSHSRPSKGLHALYIFVKAIMERHFEMYGSS